MPDASRHGSTAAALPAFRLVTLVAVPLLLGGCEGMVSDAESDPSRLPSASSSRAGFDGQGHFTISGKPTFILGVYDTGLGYTTDENSWEETLFASGGKRELQNIPLNFYLNYQLGAMPIAATQSLLNVLQRHGMMYIQTGNCFDSGSWTRYGPGSFSIMDSSYVQQFAQHPAAFGYYVMDECTDSLLAETTQHHQQLKSWDGQGLTLAVTLADITRDPSPWVNAADVIGTDPYPLFGAETSAGYPHFDVADNVGRLRLVTPASKPVVSVLQLFQFTSNSRMPSYDEMRSHAVMSIVEGAQGLIWWEIGVNGLRHQTDTVVKQYMGHLQTLVQELKALEPALLASPATSALAGNSTKASDPVATRASQLDHDGVVLKPYNYFRGTEYQNMAARLRAGNKAGIPLLDDVATVRMRAKVVDGVGYLFAYNYTNTTTPVTFTWSSTPSNVQEHASGKAYALSGSSWSDSFGPYEARIYVIGGAGTAPPPPPPPPPPMGGGSTPFGGTPAAIPGIIQAENFDEGGEGIAYHDLTASNDGGEYRNTAVDIQTTTDAGGGFNVGWIGAGEWLDYTVNVAASGGFDVEVRVASIYSGKSLHLEVDGKDVTGPMSVPNTGSWQNWQSITKAGVTIASGVHVLRLVADNNLFNVNYLKVTNAGSSTPALPPGNFTASILYPAAGAKVPTQQQVGLSSTAPWGQNKTYSVFLDSQQVYTITLAGTTNWPTLDLSGFAAGSHTLKLLVVYNGTQATASIPVTLVSP